MIYILGLLSVAVFEWIILPFLSSQDAWRLTVGCAFLSLAIYSLWKIKPRKETLFTLSINALFCIAYWFRGIAYGIHELSGEKINIILPIFVIFTFSFIHILKRQYDVQGDKFNPQNVNILLLKPRSTWDVIKAFFGAPVASVCIAIGDNAYSFRYASGTFEKMPFGEAWLKRHIIIDTKVLCTDEILAELEKVIGEHRAPYCKCVWSIRHVLKLVGGKYEIKNWWQYMPGIYGSGIINHGLSSSV